jgi:hypothetical protein
LSRGNDSNIPKPDIGIESGLLDLSPQPNGPAGAGIAAGKRKEHLI